MDTPLNWIPLSTSVVYILFIFYQIYQFNQPAKESNTFRAILIKSSAKSSKFPHYLSLLLPSFLLGITITFYAYFAKEPLRILRRGKPTFAFTTDYDNADEARRNAWDALYAENITRLTESEEALWRFARTQRWCFVIASLLVLWVFVNDLWSRKEIFRVRKTEILSGTQKNEYEIALNKWKRGCRQRYVFVLLATILGVIGASCPVGAEEGRFLLCLKEMVGVEPMLDIEWHTCIGGVQVLDFYIC